MIKFSKILISLAGLALAMPLLAVSSAPSTYAFTCGIGQTTPNDSPPHLAAPCVGAQTLGNDQWVLPAISVSAGTRPGVIAIGPGARLFIPFYSVVSSPTSAAEPDITTTRWYTGPGLVKKWSIPPDTGAEIFALPTHSGQSENVAVTLDWASVESHYTVQIPALDLAHVSKDLQLHGQTMPLSSQESNTVPVQYRANESALSLDLSGPWAESITVPAGHASFFREPANPGGLVLSATPDGSGDAVLGVSGSYAELTVPGAVSPPTPKPVPKVVSPVPAPTLQIVAPARKRVGQPIPATITILRNGTPDAHAVVTVRASIGRLSRSSGVTNTRGQIHVVITRAPIGRLAITAITGKAHGRAAVRVMPKPAAPFPWWSLLGLLGLVLLGVLIVVASVRNWRRWRRR